MKAIHIPKKQIDESLEQAPLQGKHNLEPFHSFAKENNLPISLLEDHELRENEAEVHQHEADLWLSLQGEVTFICGGELVDPWIKKNKDGTENLNELRAKSIKDGKVYILHEGDWLFIPAGVPHTHTALETAKLAIIKIPKV